MTAVLEAVGDRWQFKCTSASQQHSFDHLERTDRPLTNSCLERQSICEALCSVESKAMGE